MFNEQFESLRRKHGKTLSEMARILNLPQSTVSSWKSRGLTPNAKTLLEIARYFNVSIDFLITGEESDQRVVEKIAEHFPDAQIKEDGDTLSISLVKTDPNITMDEALLVSLSSKFTQLDRNGKDSMLSVGDCLLQVNKEGQNKIADQAFEVSQNPLYKKEDKD